MADSTPMMLQYESIKSQYPDAILFFRLGDFYEMFRSDAIEASRLLGLTLTQRQGVPMCGIPHHASKAYIVRLIEAGKKVAICEQTQVPVQGRGLSERQVTQVISPGTLVDEEFIAQTGNNFLVSVSRPKRPDQPFAMDRIALCDISTGEIFLRSSSSESLCSELETIFAKWLPREILVQESYLHDFPDLSELLKQYPSMLVNRFGDWIYDTARTYETLCRIFGLRSLQSFGIKEHDDVIHPIAPILQYGEAATKHSLEHLRNIQVIRDEDHLVLDEMAIKNLELVRNLRDGGRTFSLLSILDYCKTPMAARLLKQRLLSPLKNIDEIQSRLEKVEYLYRHQPELYVLRDNLGGILDIDRLINRVMLDRAHPKDMVAIAKSLRRVVAIREKISAPVLETVFFAVSFETLETVYSELERAFIDEPPVLLTDGGYIREGFDAKVDEYRRLQLDSQTILEEYVETEKQITGIGGLKVKHNNIIGYYLEVTKSQLTSVPGHFKRKQSLVNGERYTTDRLSELEHAIVHARDLCIQREKDLFISIRGAIKKYAVECISAGAAVAEIDVFANLAWVATAKGYTRPQLSNETIIEIKGGRHPVVESVIGNDVFIPNSLELGTESIPATTALITGPNMAGKSTFLRQTALIGLMAQMGSFVPADYAKVGIIDRLFCRVGASDNLARGESTFLVEMNETAFILRHATSRSLVIMDEVGRGTSTQDGLSIAHAVLDHFLSALRCRCLFATHFHELTEVQSEAMVNLSMQVEERNGTIEFLKKVIQGPSSNSYGIHVAQLAGLPSSVLRKAEEVLDALSQATTAFPAHTNRSPISDAIPRMRQQSLFSPLDEIETHIKSLDIDKLTPLDALNLLQMWKNKLRT